MCRRTCLVILFVLAVIVLLRIHTGGHRVSIPASADSSEDVAAAMRSITGSTEPIKPWAADFADFASSHPGNWIVGRSTKPCLSEDEAQRDARDDAAGKVYATVTKEIAPSAWLARSVIADVRNGTLEVDHQTERFDRPYGTIWTQAVLFDTSSPQWSDMMERYRREMWRLHTIRSIFRFSVLGLMLSAWLLYVALNFVTRGYFTLHLRLIAGTITVCALLILLGGP